MHEQRIAARMITGAFKTAPSDALEYLADLLPMDLRLNVAVHSAALRLAALPPHRPLYSTVAKCQQRAPRYFKLPLHKIFIAFPDLLDVEVIDSTPRARDFTQPITKYIAPSRELAASAVAAREASDAFVVYTDGSGEGAQVGAAAVATLPQGNVEALRAHLGPLETHTVFEGELFGILLALRLIADTPGVIDAVVCLDNQAAIVRAQAPLLRRF